MLAPILGGDASSHEQHGDEGEGGTGEGGTGEDPAMRQDAMFEPRHEIPLLLTIQWGTQATLHLTYPQTRARLAA